LSHATEPVATQVAAAVLQKLEPILKAEKPDWVLVQGDTTTVIPYISIDSISGL